MNLLKEVLRHEVFPALGCTEPIAVAYAAGQAASQLAGAVEDIRFRVDPGVYKNGMAVTVPNTGGEKGNLIAGVLGAFIRRPELKMEILSGVTPDMIRGARELIDAGRASISCDKSKIGLFIEVVIRSAGETVRAVIERQHTHLVCLEKNSEIIYQATGAGGKITEPAYKSILKESTISGLVSCAEGMDDEDAEYLGKGVEMNLAISTAGREIKKVGYYLLDLKQKGYLTDDIFSSSKIVTAAAADARMAGMNYPVMSSGGSGNQGVVAILVPHLVGQRFGIDEHTILKSIALSHLMNSFVKCYTGDLSPICGCAIAAGVGAAAAIVYQQAGEDIGKITLSINNLISDLGGMLCDGAKGGCALKVVSSTDSAIRSAYMALNDHGITAEEGFIGRTGEESIRNLSRISEIGMAKVDDTMLDIMAEKS